MCLWSANYQVFLGGLARQATGYRLSVEPLWSTPAAGQGIPHPRSAGRRRDHAGSGWKHDCVDAQPWVERLADDDTERRAARRVERDWQHLIKTVNRRQLCGLGLRQEPPRCRPGGHQLDHRYQGV